MSAQAPPLPTSSFGSPCIGNALVLPQDPLAFARAVYAAHRPAIYGRWLVDCLARISRIIAAQLATWGDSGTRRRSTATQVVTFRLAMSLLDDQPQVAHDDIPLNRPTGDVLITYAA